MKRCNYLWQSRLKENYADMTELHIILKHWTWHELTWNWCTGHILASDRKKQIWLHYMKYFQFSPSPPLDNIRVMVIVWRLGGNIIRTALCWIVWHNVHSQQHTYMSSSYRSNRLGLWHWDPYTVHRGGCLELYYCNMVEWFWWDSSLILMTIRFPSVLWHCWFGHLACNNRLRNDLHNMRTL